MGARLKLLPLLLLYLLIVVFHLPTPLDGDEGRYIVYARNLSLGHYSPGELELINGPGYPLVLLPFILLKAPWWTARTLNALFLFLAILYFFCTLRHYLKESRAFYAAFALGLNPLFLKEMHLLYTEVFAIFLISGLIFHFCKAHGREEGNRRELGIAAFYLGFLALTKVFYGYVLLAGLIFFLFVFWIKKNEALKKTFWLYFFALLFCAPYLLYTYSLTGKPFLWGTSGGACLHWMSSPFGEELGDWRGNRMGQLQAFGVPETVARHGKLFEEISSLHQVEADVKFLTEALKNIYAHPLKFIKNWICNVGRLLFDYPFSYTSQRMSTLFNIGINMFIAVFSVVCAYLSFIGRKKIPFEIFSLLFFAVISFGGNSLLCAYERLFRVLVPIFSLWILVTLSRTVTVKIR